MVEAEGMAPITNDLQATKKASLADAQRVAVEKVVGVFVSGKTLVEKAITIEQNILVKTAGYIKKYEVIKEWQEQGFYHTRIKALVSYQKILDDLNKMAILQSHLIGNPRIVILIKEIDQANRIRSISTTLSDTLAQGLIKQGYKVIDRSELASIGEQDLHRDNTDQILKQLRKKLKAEILITGEAVAVPLISQELSGLISFRATLTAKALKTQTGEVLASTSMQGSGVDITEEAAFQKTMAILGEKSANDFAETLISFLAARPSISLKINGLKNFNKLLEVKETLTRVNGVGEVFARSFSEGIAEMEVTTTSAASGDIAKELTKKGWRVVNQTHDTLEIN
ncbi:MAG TPA: hypothetical protein VI387_01070, partial [Candidatus Brocadiales bacterium]|nr:hypothetical protein [Candidatus Brocadiales bacterium]